ncbi:UDP-3-O-(3-hydroxymyristoyl) glucosamine N-acyltransferase [Nitrincola sp. A-D6]|uniref:UDP-3-O-(3-hydroxymyristoyl)glucosamine N-acyltransferase n=1 Tax=Nitrincola sp. A-D6 TaxID=1545442 RepID=UPI00051FB640|nr:UDP-3-O-(3-hydroxymyristoyl)glucosamine N-acyltransferase [Nitrincola sp. A-D6]KGK42513.1 UDP-3-O-(3-hydroxymyristoyl) glucosamine N-acyltransferase [Nitrincola sp. A-D6]
MYILSELAEYVGGQLSGDPNWRVTGLATLEEAQSDQLSFFANPRYLKQLKASTAGAVLVHASATAHVKYNALVVDDPYLAYARLSQLFDWRDAVLPGICSTATVDATAQIDPSAQICAQAVLAADVIVEAGVYIAPHVVIGRGCRIGKDTRLESGVVLYPDVIIGARVIIHSGSVLGADGFGFARHQQQWVKICQLGGVRIGDDVEIGAGVTIDRGALSPTRIEQGVKLDNQIQIAHNVVIGEHTAIAGCTGIAGSTRIGKRCTLAGMVGVTGHLTLADDTHVTAMSLVSKSIDKPGTYSSGTGLEPHQQWKRNVVRFRQLDDLAKRVRSLEQAKAEDINKVSKT